MMNIIYESMVNHLREKALDEIMIIYDIYIYYIIICNMYVCDRYIIIYIYNYIILYTHSDSKFEHVFNMLQKDDQSCSRTQDS
jgi:hypothetical protein